MNLDPSRLEGARIWIPGATGHLGWEVALAAAAHGAQLVLTGRTHDSLEALAEEVRREGGYAVVAPGDVAKDQDVRRVAEVAGDLLEGLDALVDLAVVRLDKGLLVDAPAETLNRTLAVNVRAAWLCARAAAGLMTGGGRIVHVLCEGEGAFAVSQAALAGLTEVLGLELAPRGILVNGIDPAPLDEDSIDAILTLASLPPDGPSGCVFDKTLEDDE